MKILPTIIFLSVLVSFLSACRSAAFGNKVVVTSISNPAVDDTPDQEICRSFTLTKQDVATYFTVADEVDEYTFNQEAIILPCKYRGTIDVDGKVLQWEISAGGAGYLYGEKSINKRYLCRESCCAILPGMC